MRASTVSNAMRKHLLCIAATSLLLSACGPSEPDPMPAPRPDDDAPEAASDSSAMEETGEETGTPGDVGMSGAASEGGSADRLDVENAMAEPATDGVWVTQPNWTGFGPANSEAVFMVACGEFGMIRLTRVIDIESGTPLTAAIAAGDSEERGYWKIEDQQENPSAVFEAYAEAPVFDAMKSADKIAVLAEGKPNLIIPGSDQLTQQINSCQDQGSGTP